MNWSELIKELELAGWSLTDIGREVGLSTSSISDLKNARSTEPRGMAAVRLHELQGQSPPALAQEKAA